MWNKSGEINIEVTMLSYIAPALLVMSGVCGAQSDISHLHLPSNATIGTLRRAPKWNLSTQNQSEENHGLSAFVLQSSK